jgi:hypothetical protein
VRVRKSSGRGSDPIAKRQMRGRSSSSDFRSTCMRSRAVGYWEHVATILLKLELPILVVAGIIGQKSAAKLWSRLLGHEAPNTAQENVRVVELLPVAIVEGRRCLARGNRVGRVAGDRPRRERHRRTEREGGTA